MVRFPSGAMNARDSPVQRMPQGHRLALRCEEINMYVRIICQARLGNDAQDYVL
jgi:hypothetical protein